MLVQQINDLTILIEEVKTFDIMQAKTIQTQIDELSAKLIYEEMYN